MQADSFDPRAVLGLLALVDTGKPCGTCKEIMHTIFDEKNKGKYHLKDQSLNGSIILN
jgi:cytidine deaminase